MRKSFKVSWDKSTIRALCRLWSLIFQKYPLRCFLVSLLFLILAIVTILIFILPVLLISCSKFISKLFVNWVLSELPWNLFSKNFTKKLQNFMKQKGIPGKDPSEIKKEVGGLIEETIGQIHRDIASLTEENENFSEIEQEIIELIKLKIKDIDNTFSETPEPFLNSLIESVRGNYQTKLDENVTRLLLKDIEKICCEADRALQQSVSNAPLDAKIALGECKTHVSDFFEKEKIPKYKSISGLIEEEKILNQMLASIDILDIASKIESCLRVFLEDLSREDMKSLKEQYDRLSFPLRVEFVYKDNLLKEFLNFVIGETIKRISQHIYWDISEPTYKLNQDKLREDLNKTIDFINFYKQHCANLSIT